MAYCDSPTWDEVAHFAAALQHWRDGRFDLYPVNPPLVRLAAGVPVAILTFDDDLNIGTVIIKGGRRPEFAIGEQLVQRYGVRYFRLMAIARWACVPFTLWGAWLSFRWARDLYGREAGYTALILWASSPTVLAYGHLITPDVGAAAFGIAAGYSFWRWLRQPSWRSCGVAGLMLGLAELTKMTWIVLFVLWPILWLARWWSPAGQTAGRNRWREFNQLAGILVLAVWIMNLGYGFEGSFKALGEYRFRSSALGGVPPAAAGAMTTFHNRFTDSCLAKLLVPVPESYLQGIDFIKWEYEIKYPSYLRGEWRDGGWWYYYLYAMLVKEPLGTWLIFALAVVASMSSRWPYRACLGDELCLLLPAAAVLILVSSQTGFNHHLRYVLPAFPFIFIWVSKVARSVQLGHRRVTAVAGLALAWSVVSSLSAFPHSLSYFNELAGGPRGGHWHLGNSNADWGQDLLYLKAWYDRHPEARPLHLGYDLPLIDPRTVGIEWDEPPAAAEARPGWYALSVNRMHAMDGRLRPFLDLEPVAMAGYSIYIYHLSPADADRLRALALQKGALHDGTIADPAAN